MDQVIAFFRCQKVFDAIDRRIVVDLSETRIEWINSVEDGNGSGVLLLLLLALLLMLLVLIMMVLVLLLRVLVLLRNHCSGDRRCS